MKVFISYRHHQKDWVRDRLVPCLRYGGAEVIIDDEKFGAGRTVVGEKDGYQDAADCAVLVLTPDYLASEFCVHEMERALSRKQPIVPIVRALDAQPAPEDEAIARSLRRRELMAIDGDEWRLRVPLMERWLRVRG